MSDNKTVQLIIPIGWMVFGWILLVGLAGLAALFALHHVSPFIPPDPYHDLFGTLFVFVAWPLATLALRFCARHRVWNLLWF